MESLEPKLTRKINLLLIPSLIGIVGMICFRQFATIWWWIIGLSLGAYVLVYAYFCISQKRYKLLSVLGLKVLLWVVVFYLTFCVI